MIAAWVATIVAALCGVGVVAWLIYCVKENECGTAGGIAGVLVTLVITAAVCGGIQWWLHCTEAGRRAIKDTQSNISGGIERTVTVYDINGDVIETYSGRFDVDYDSDRIKFDDEDGKRHVIYYTTGTVIIDEN